MPVSSYLLLGANLVPLLGVLFFEWDTILVLALFWMENLVIGAFTLLRIACVSVLGRNWSGLYIGAFFLVHYGAFCSAHGMLLSDLLDYQVIPVEQLFNIDSRGIHRLYLDGAAVFMTFIKDLSPAVLIGLIGLVLSRLGSFIENFILRGQVFELTARKLMAQPYSQIIVMHAGLLIGAVLLTEAGSPVWLLAVLVLLKILVDFKQFQRRHVNSMQRHEQVKDF